MKTESRTLTLKEAMKKQKAALHSLLNDLEAWKANYLCTTDPAQQQYFDEKHTEARCECLNHLVELDNVLTDLGIENDPDQEGYLKKYQANMYLQNPVSAQK